MTPKSCKATHDQTLSHNIQYPLSREFAPYDPKSARSDLATKSALHDRHKFVILHPMETLPELLQHRTVRELGTVARRHGLPFNNKLPKPMIYARLVEQLRTGGYLKRTWRTLPAPARDALRSLQVAGGAMPLVQFESLFGVLRRYRPWREDGDRFAWKHPASIAETLWYGGFIERSKTRVMLCTDMVALLPPLPRVHPTPAPEVTSTQPADLLRDVAALLGLVAGQPVKLVYKRFLPPRAFRLLNTRLTRSEPDISPFRSERQLGYLRFVHYLAECAGLVEAVGGVLRLSVTAWEWLALPPKKQWARLMASVRKDIAKREPLWSIYCLPAVDKTLWTAIHHILSTLRTGAVYRMRGFVRALRIQCPTVTRAQVQALLAEPLAWSGRVLMSEDARSFAVLAADQPDLSAPQPAALHLDHDALTVHLPPLPMLHPLVELCSWATIDGSRLQSLRIDRGALQRAARQQIKPVQIADMLREITGAGIAPDIYAWLEAQYRQCGQLRIEQVTVLRATNPDTLRDLYGDRTMRARLGQSLSPHYATVKLGKQDELARSLARRDLIPDADAAQSTQPDILSQTGYSWLAMRVYQDLRALFPQQVRLPGAVSDELKHALPLDQQHSLEAAAQDIIDRVKRAIHGDVASFAVSPIAPDDPAGIRAAVERAYESQTPLTIDYFSPSHGIQTRRTITPTQPIRWNGQIGYIYAYCQLDGEGRTFRTDRILKILNEDGNHDRERFSSRR
jgi:hypothetical protein